MSSRSVKSFSTIASKRLLYIIVTTLVFEGVVRKLSPAFVSSIIFFLKDILCLMGMYVVLNTHASKLYKPVLSIWGKIFFAILPLLIYTFFLSPSLSPFGAKQYLLFIVVALMVPLAFPKENSEELKRFLFFISFLLLPTTLTAILQSNLPATHWLNRGIGGISLAGFASKGKLRVSSTFSFTGQYSFYLNIVSVVFAASFFIPPTYNLKLFKRYKSLIYIVLTIMLVIGNFITGGRTAVLGSGAGLAIGFALTAIRYPAWFVTKGVLMIVAAIFGLSAIKIAKPEYFEVYERRSQGNEEQSHSEEVEGRLLGSFVSWTSWFNKREVGAMILGEGLGVMSNGSDKVSSYAYQIRSTGAWTETDFSTTLWEGGIYLAIIWYAFRLYITYYCYRLCQRMKIKKYAIAARFLLGNVFVNSVVGTISIQPPLAIWYWFAVGAIIAIHQCDHYIFTEYRKKTVFINN